MAGPILAAIVIAQAGIAWAFAVNAASYLAPIAAMAYLAHRGLAAGAANRVKAGAQAVATSAVDYVREHRWVVAILIGVVSTSAPLEIVRTLTPAIAVGLDQPESAAGFLVAAQSIGSAIALRAFVPQRRSGRSGDLARVGLVIQAIGLLLTVLAGEFWLALLAGGFLGFGFSLCFPVLTSALQAEVPDAVRGRIMSYHQMFHLGNRPFAALAAGVAAVVVGAQAAVGIGLLLTPVGIVASRRAWRALAAERLQRASGRTGPVAVTDADAREEEQAVEAVAAEDLLGVGSGAPIERS
jgi:uncharacterized membrane protein (DUF4010 family)